ncbi:MAG TPA: ATP-binding cassette domain-containing protein [Abditibacteriaceae bacterium]
MSDFVLDLRGVSKTFGDFAALLNVDFQVHTGEIVALLGENGAGKSTLLNIVAGNLAPSTGELLFDGAPLSRAAAIGVVHQHFRLVPAFSVAENLALAAPAESALFHAADWNTRATEWAAQLGWKLDGAALVSSLGVGEQQRVEIIKALFCQSRKTRLLLLDEPTANLTPDEARDLFRVVHKLREDGCAVVFVSHKLNEVLELCDRVEVLRHGEIVGSRTAGKTSAEELAALMVGESARIAESTAKIDRTFPTSDSPVAIQLHDVSCGQLRAVNLTVRAGEIVAIAGVDGNGQRDLVDVLSGVRTLLQGRIEATGRIAVVPPDRNTEGTVRTFDIAENFALDSEFRARFRRRFSFDWRGARERARTLGAQFDVRSPRAADQLDRAQASQLSGGNAQKVVLARALDSQSPVLVAADPTRGLDIGATRFVHAQLREAAARGVAVLLISSDLDEALFLGDRIGALYEGQLLPAKLLPRGTARETIGALMGGKGSTVEIDRTAVL